MYTAVTVMSGAIVTLVFFDRQVTSVGVGSFIAIITVTSAAEQLGWLPYAPLLNNPPFSNGRLAPVWLFSNGGMDCVTLIGVLAMMYGIITSWREYQLKLVETTDQLTRANDLISRYIAAQLVEEIRRGNFDAVDRQDRRRLTIFFSDIQGFSEMADRVEPEDLSRLLNEYLTEMTEIAQRHGGTIDKFIGDAIMIFFGAPVATDDRDHALRAIRMAIEMQSRMAVLRERWRLERVQEPFAIRIGINSGVVSVGNFGARGRVDYTAIGRQVNLAARLQAICDPGGILFSHATWCLVRKEISCRAKGEIQVKGMNHPVQIYEVVGDGGAAFVDDASGGKVGASS